jgi:hypothetical protein
MGASIERKYIIQEIANAKGQQIQKNYTKY